jgi:ELWxxDGT repeat protein
MTRAANFCAAVLVLGASLCLPTLAGEPQLVRNINTQPVGRGSDPVFLGSLGGFTYFASDDGVHGKELWKTDGTAGNTTVIDIETGPGSSHPASFVVLGSLGYFSAATTASGRELWVTDGTAAGTRQVAELAPGNQSSDVRVAGALGPTLLLFGNDASGMKLWRSDGTQAGTSPLAGGGFHQQLVVASNGKAYFSGHDPSLASEPWVTDGTVAGTQRLEDGAPGTPINSPSSFVQAGSFVYFIGSIGNGIELWRISLNDDAIEKVTTGLDVHSGFAADRPALTVLGNAVVFVAAPTGSTVREVWRASGPGSAVSLGSFSSTINGGEMNPRFTALGNRVLFANSNGTRVDLQSTDGASVQSLIPGLTLGVDRVLEAAGPWLYFIPLGSAAVYRTDGTPAGTQQAFSVADFGPLLGVLATAMAGDAGTLYFSFHGQDLLTGLGGHVVTRYEPASNTSTVVRRAPASSAPAEVFAFANGRLFFSPFSFTNGHEPWTSDGTVAGTREIANLSVETEERSSHPNQMVAFQDRLYFAADDDLAGRELWRSDGTANGTELVAEVMAGTPDSLPDFPFAVGNSLLFFAFGPGASMKSLWRHDPASRSHEKLADAREPFPLHPLAGGPFISVAAQGFTYFSARAPTVVAPAVLHGLWRTDGTVAGTENLSNVATVLAGVRPIQYAELGGKVYFIGEQFGQPPPIGYGLWVTDGTAAGTQRLAFHSPSIAPGFLRKLGDRLFYAASDGSGLTLWRSDGTAAGTVAVVDFPDVAAFAGVVNQRLLFQARPAPSGPVQYWTLEANASSFGVITNVTVFRNGAVNESGTRLFFSGFDAGRGIGPWVTDGTEAGTQPLRDVAPNDTMEPEWLGDFHDVAIFTAQDSQANPARRYWATDGTPAGTRAIGAVGANRTVVLNTPVAVTAGNHFFFSVTDPDIGTELYALENEAPIAAADAATTTAGQAVTVNVLGNDTDADGSLDPSRVTITSAPANGTAAVTSAGGITYTPNAGFSGSDSFSYSVRDRQGRSSAPAAVSVSIAAASPSGGGSGSGSSGGGGGALGWLTLLALVSASCAGQGMAARNSRIRR